MEPDLGSPRESFVEESRMGVGWKSGQADIHTEHSPSGNLARIHACRSTGEHLTMAPIPLADLTPQQFDGFLGHIRQAYYTNVYVSNCSCNYTPYTYNPPNASRRRCWEWIARFTGPARESRARPPQTVRYPAARRNIPGAEQPRRTRPGPTLKIVLRQLAAR